MNDELRNLLYQLVRTGRQAHMLMDAPLSELDFTPSKLLVLDVMHDSEAKSLGELASVAVCAKSNITQIVDSLESNGLVRRVADPHDRRTTLLETTDVGDQTYDSAVETLNPLLEKLQTLSPAERTQLFSLLERVSAALK